MAEPGGEGVEAMAVLSFDGEGPVKPVVDDVHPGKGELCADLVGDARVDRDLQQRPLLVLDGAASGSPVGRGSGGCGAHRSAGRRARWDRG